jgi:perosamine synthetase
MKKSIPLLRPYFDSDEINEIQKVLDSGWVSQGPKVKEFERKVSEYLDIPHCIAVTNCTSALHLTLLASGIGSGDEVLVADYTYPATGHSVLYCGASPVFVDVDLKTYNIDTNRIEEKIKERTKAIIPVHTFGQPCDMERIMTIAEDQGLVVIEDAACAFGAKRDGRYAGTIGDVGCFSFHARKGITTGEGGMVVTRNGEMAEKIRKLSVFGISAAWEREESENFHIPEFTEIGYNYKMSDIAAAVGSAQLKKLDRIIERKRELAKYWDGKLESIDLIEPPFVDESSFHIYQSYVTVVDEKIERNKLIVKLADQGIQAQIGTYSSHIQPVYGSQDKCPNSLEIFNRALALPMFYELGEGGINFASSTLESVIKEMAR